MLHSFFLFRKKGLSTKMNWNFPYRHVSGLQSAISIGTREFPMATKLSSAFQKALQIFQSLQQASVALKKKKHLQK